MFSTFCSITKQDRNLNKLLIQKGLKIFTIIVAIVISSGLVFAGGTPLSKQEVAEIERSIVYTFKDQGVLTDVFRPSNLSLLRPTAFQELEFLGDKIINAFIVYSIFSRTDSVEGLKRKLSERTQGTLFLEKFKALGLSGFLKNNSSASLETFYSRSFKALVGAMYLDVKQQNTQASEKFRQFMIKNLGLTPLSFTTPSSSGFDCTRKKEIETKLGYNFQEESWLSEVFQRTSSTYGSSYQSWYGNQAESTMFEQLGFLGDKVLDVSIADNLFSSKEDITGLKEKFEAKTKATYLEQQSKCLQLTDLLRDPLKNRPDLAFKALVASILLDSSKESDPCSYSRKRSPFFVISPETIRFVAKNTDLSPSTIVPSSPFITAGISEVDMKSAEERIGYSFKNKELLTSALYHSSLVQRPTEFEQLEFLGDRIINAVVAVSIFSGSETTGRLQAQFEAKTKNTYFRQKFEEMGLGRFLQRNPSSNDDKVFADAFEALVGAIYLDAKGDAVLPVEILRFLSKTLGLETSSICIPVPPVISSATVSTATPAIPSTCRHPQPVVSMMGVQPATPASPTEEKIQAIIGQHRKWVNLPENEKRKRALQSWEASIKSKRLN